MSKVSVLVPPAPRLCQECVDNSRHQSELIGVVWCEHHRSGGLYIVEAGMWVLHGPFAQESDFKRLLLSRVQPGVEH